MNRNWKIITPVVLSLLALVCLCWPVAARAAGDAGKDVAGRLVYAQGQVSVSAPVPPGGGTWEEASIGSDLAPGDSVRTGPGARAAILCADETQIRLGENTLITLKNVTPSARLGFASTGSGGSGPSRFGLESGEAWLRNNNDTSKFQLQTPALTAAVRGTEFTAAVAPDGLTRIALLSGGLILSNPQGTLDLDKGELGQARPGQAPFKQVLVNPEDAVQWVLYYPAAISWRDVPTGGAAEAEPWLALARSGRTGQAWQACEAALPNLRPTPALMGVAATLALATGNPAKARTLLEKGLAADPADAFCLSLMSQIELVQNHGEKALATAARALAANPSSPAALLAMALVDLSRFDLASARANLDKALKADPSFVAAYVYKARIELGMDAPDKAWAMVEKALTLAPGDPSALSLGGFAKLGMRRFDEAQALFDRATAADPGLPEPRLGSGMVSFSRNQRFQGLSEFLGATLLDPRVSLYQTSLGKGYYASRAFDKAMESYDQAARLDPADPTPHLYKGIALTDLYQPGDAVAELNKSISLNDNRAMFRSRLLLDRDLAVRNFDLAKAYNQLGLGEWAFAKAVSSVKKDPFDSSAHLFLSSAFAGTRQRVSASGSELLLYRLLSPANQNSFTVYNDYTPMFEAPYLRFQLTGSGGLWANGNPTLDTSVEAYGGVPGVAADAYASYTQDNGMRRLNGLNRNGFAFGQFKWEPTVKDSLYTSLTLSRTRTGDVSSQNAWEYIPSPWQENNYSTANVELGYVRRQSPGWTTILYGAYKYNGWSFSDRYFNPTDLYLGDIRLNDVSFRYRDSPREMGNFQAQQQMTLGNHSFLVGGDVFTSMLRYRSYQNVTISLLPEFSTLAATGDNQWERSLTVYAMDYWRIRKDLVLELGLSLESGTTPRFGFHSMVGDTIPGFRFGANWEATGKDVIRLAVQRYLNNHVALQPMLQPSETAGFPTRVNADDGSRVIEAGLTWERQWDDATFSVLRGDFHRIENPQYDPLQSYDRKVWFDTNRYLVSGSVNRVLTPYLGANLVGVVKWLEPGTVETRVNPETHYVEFSGGGGLTFLYKNGFGAAVSGQLIKQTFMDNRARDLLGRHRDESVFGLLNARLSYDFPGKRGFASLEGRNLLDTKFSYQREPVALDAFAPSRQVVLRLGWYF